MTNPATATTISPEEQGALDEMNADLIAHNEAPFTIGQFRRVTELAQVWAEEVERMTIMRLVQEAISRTHADQRAN